jgi:hypothetical protein
VKRQIAVCRPVLEDEDFERPAGHLAIPSEATRKGPFPGAFSFT